MGKGLEMNILVNTKKPSAKRAEDLGIDRFYSFDEVLEECDFLVLAIPALKENTNLISKRQLKKMKKFMEEDFAKLKEW